jgi:hypothetical protein
LVRDCEIGYVPRLSSNHLYFIQRGGLWVEWYHAQLDLSDGQNYQIKLTSALIEVTTFTQPNRCCRVVLNRRNKQRLNVAHEAGMCQGRLGLSTAIILLEDGPRLEPDPRCSGESPRNFLILPPIQRSKNLGPAPSLQLRVFGNRTLHRPGPRRLIAHAQLAYRSRNLRSA